MVKEKKAHIEAMRLVAIFLVIYNHTRANGFDLYTTTDNSIVILCSLFLSILCKIAVPVFFMLSGAVLLEKEESIGTFFKKRVLRIIIVIVLFTFLQYIRLIIAGKATFSVSTYLLYLYSGNVIEPYWYLKAYLAFLLTVPFLRKIAKLMDKDLSYYLLILCGLKIITSIIMVFAGLYSNVALEFTSDILLYPLLGFSIEKGFFNCRKKNALLVFFLLLILNTALMYWYKVSFNAWNGDLLTIFIIPISFLFYCTFMNLKYSAFTKTTVLKLGPCVFGVYLIEDVIRNFVEFRLNFYSFVSIPVLSALIFSLICVTMGLIIIFFVRKIPFVSKYI